MMTRIAAALIAATIALPTYAAGLPQHVGQCATAGVLTVTHRLRDAFTGEDAPWSGSAIRFDNKGWQISYGQEPSVDHSRPGDDVKICLVYIPPNCPPGDNRGRIYHTTNMRTKESWTLPDAQHGCGGI